MSDYKGLCPNSLRGTEVDSYGCKPQQEIVFESVEFGRNQARLQPSASSILTLAAQRLLQHPNMLVELAGYTDIRGSELRNIELSYKRARAVQQFLVSRGVDARRMSVKGYGSNNPRATNDTVEGRHKNRRVSLRILQ